MNPTVAILMIGLTISMYFVMNVIYVRLRSPFLVPILTTTIGVVVVLTMLDTTYDTYMIGGQWIDALLGPAIVSLCIPLYKQRELIKKNLLPIFSGVIAGGIVGMVTGVLAARMAGFSLEFLASILPKSITSPIAMQISEELGGIPSLATVFVIIAGLAGILVGPVINKWLSIDSAIGQGIGLGVAAHAIGTSKALEYGEREASMSSVAMTLSAIIGALVGPLFGLWLF
ncbi:LrgB family protein [Sporosarcina sp. PTS2304]|uniref:LrgB family protein n=1 Tax=Sporosarcina sp. PTS2304 TaxID=2283194 RepID=UPI000E0D9310|nr:LrgB family protein [Sporosarcina sp. PTS2304]AXH98919.1 LrgB family protein [Sporosarcina sp. PTS2304]